jgi:3-oxoacyl-[acyl-carrier protein] reductase
VGVREDELLRSRFAGLSGRVALVTGAGRGIGRCIADNLEAQGSRVAVVDLAFPEDDGAAGGERLAIRADLREAAEIDSAFDTVERELGSVEILVCNAGVIRTGTVTDIDADDWAAVMAVNSTAPFLLARRAVPAMRAAGFGRIVHVSSNAAKMGGVTSAPVYGASKAATDTMLRGIAVAEARHGITANAVAAALIDTEMLAHAGLDERIGERIPAGRLGTPRDIAAAVLFLASDEAGFVTGEVMDVNGGFYVD